MTRVIINKSGIISDLHFDYFITDTFHYRTRTISVSHSYFYKKSSFNIYNLKHIQTLCSGERGKIKSIWISCISILFAGSTVGEKSCGLNSGLWGNNNINDENDDDHVDDADDNNNNI